MTQPSFPNERHPSQHFLGEPSFRDLALGALHARDEQQRREREERERPDIARQRRYIESLGEALSCAIRDAYNLDIPAWHASYAPTGVSTTFDEGTVDGAYPYVNLEGVLLTVVYPQGRATPALLLSNPRDADEPVRFIEAPTLADVGAYLRDHAHTTTARGHALRFR